MNKTSAVEYDSGGKVARLLAATRITERALSDGPPSAGSGTRRRKDRVLDMASGDPIPLGDYPLSHRMTVGGKDVSKYTELDVDRLRDACIEEMGQECGIDMVRSL